jgi:hypothetical protein
MNDNILLTKKMLTMHAKHQEGWVEACYHPDCDWVELPIPGQSKGRSGNAAAMKDAADLSMGIFPTIDITINNIMAEDDRVAVEIDFVGTMAKKPGSDKPAKKALVKMAIFLTIEEGLITRQVDYLVPMG